MWFGTADSGTDTKMAIVAIGCLQWMQWMKGYRKMTTPTPFPWQATAQLGRILIDFIETIAYR
jgi:hypothetical protein